MAWWLSAWVQPPVPPQKKKYKGMILIYLKEVIHMPKENCVAFVLFRKQEGLVKIRLLISGSCAFNVLC